jgi:hypothetical protein
MDWGPVIGAIEEGGLSFIWFVVMVVVIFVVMLVSIAR